MPLQKGTLCFLVHHRHRLSSPGSPFTIPFMACHDGAKKCTESALKGASLSLPSQRMGACVCWWERAFVLSQCCAAREEGDSPEAAKHSEVSVNFNATECCFWVLTTCSGRLQREQSMTTDVNGIIRNVCRLRRGVLAIFFSDSAPSLAGWLAG